MAAQSTPSTPGRTIARLWSRGLVDPDTVHRLDRRQHEVDERGYRVHLALGMFFCVLLAFPVSYVEFAGLPVGVMWLLRIWCLWRLSLCILGLPIFLTLLAYAAWQLTSLAWSPDPAAGLEEVGSLRWAWTFLALYPLLDRRRWLVGAIAVGFLIGNAVQVLHAIGGAAGWEALTFGRAPDRISGWWVPVVGGTMLTGVLGLHLPAALMGRGRTQLLGAAGALVTLLAILATGSRGPWLAGAALVGIGVVVAACAIRPRARRWRVLGVGAAGAVVLGVVAWLTVGDLMVRRVERATGEIRTALRDKQFNTDTGARLLMWWWAVEATAEHPIRGVGVGGYHEWVVAHLEAQDIDPATRPIHQHAHATGLHILATTGVVGLGLGVLVLAVVLRGGIAGLDRASLGTYEAGPVFGILGLMLAGLFDPVHINAQTAALFLTLVALCLHPRPRPAARPGEVA